MTKRTPEQYDWTNALFNDRRLSKNYTSPRRGKITHVTLHHMTIVAPADKPRSEVAVEGAYKTWMGGRAASANYGVSGDLVWQYVGDFDAAWSDANSTSNHSTLSIEHANSTAGPKWEISDETMLTGQRLVACLHRLYKLGRPSRKTVRVHQDYYPTACPGPYLMDRLDEYIAQAAHYYDHPDDADPKPEPEQPPVVCEVDPPTKPTDPPPPPPPHKDTVTIPLMLMPLAGYNKATAEGVTNWERNTLGAISQVTRHKPSILGVTELSDKKVAKMKPLFIQRATAYTTHGGSDGRYPFTRDKYTTEHIAHGAWTAPAKLNGDGKQMGWTADVVHGVRVAVGVAHCENENGKDKTSGRDADNIRVDQALQFADHLIAMAERYNCRPLLMGDFNSEGWVRDALVKQGWIPCPKPGKATGWDHKGGSVTDWIFVREGTLTSEVHDNEFSDHTIVTATWTLEV